MGKTRGGRERGEQRRRWGLVTEGWHGAAAGKCKDWLNSCLNSVDSLRFPPHALTVIHFSSGSCFGEVVILLRGEITIDSPNHFSLINYSDVSLIMQENVLRSLNQVLAVLMCWHPVYSLIPGDWRGKCVLSLVFHCHCSRAGRNVNVLIYLASNSSDV